MHADVTPHQNSLDTQKLTNNSNTLLTSAPLNSTVSTHDAKAGRRARTRLGGSGIAVLEEYVRHHPADTHPTTMTQKSLLDQVQRAQGNNDIKLLSVSNWFRRRRIKGQPPSPLHHQRQRIIAPLAPTSPTTPFTEESLHKLHTLIQATPNPGPGVLGVWASFFHVSRPVLQYAIEVVLPSHCQTASQTFPSTCQIEPSPASPTHIPPPQSRRLPTPPRSSTPELLPTDKWSRYRKSPENLKDETHSPILPNTIAAGGPSAFQRQHNRLNQSDCVCSPISLPASIPMPVATYQGPRVQLSPPPTPAVLKAEGGLKTLAAGPTASFSSPDPTLPRLSALKNAILLGLTEACIGAAQSRNKDQPPLPKTATQSDERFASYQAKLEHLSLFLDALLKPSPPSPHE